MLSLRSSRRLSLRSSLHLKECTDRDNDGLNFGREGRLRGGIRAQRGLPSPPALVGVHDGQALHVRRLGLRGGSGEQRHAVNSLEKGRRRSVGILGRGARSSHVRRRGLHGACGGPRLQRRGRMLLVIVMAGAK